MTEPVTAVDVIERALDGWIDDMLEDRVSMPQNETIVAALREACGGGDIVIRQNGTLWRKAMPVDLDIDPVHHLCIVPAGER